MAAYLYMPGMIFLTKMVPHNIEASMLGIAISIIKFNSEVLGRIWTYLLNLGFKVKIVTIEDVWKMYIVQAILLLIPFFFYKLLIERTQVELVQVLVQHSDRITRSNIRETVKLDLNKALDSLRTSNLQQKSAFNDLKMMASYER